jgi:hypothetical protein
VIETCELPNAALLSSYSESGAYTDCYFTQIAGSVSQAEYVEAFYTTWVFKLERLLLAWFVSKPSTDMQARALASGESDMFAAWRVEGRTVDELLLCDFQGRTRSWLKSAAMPNADPTSTRLYFGSAVVPVNDAKSGRKAMGWAFRALLRFHKIYSRVLLRAAVARLLRSRGNES